MRLTMRGHSPMKTIATFSKPEEAHLLRMRLGAAEIPAFIQDEHMVQLSWLWSNVIGGVRVQVAEEDFDVTQEFLAADTPQICADSIDVCCPSCGSHHAAPDELPRRIAYLCLLVFGFPLVWMRPRWRCSSCDHVFRVRETAGEAGSV